MAPVLLASYPVYVNAENASAVTTPSFSPTAGEVLVVKLSTWSTTISMGAPAGGGQAYSATNVVAPGGFNQWCGLYTATVVGSPGPMTVSSTPSSACWHSMVVERWGGARLAASPAVNAPSAGVGAPLSTLTTTADGSVVSWVSGDVNSRTTVGRAYRGGAVEDGLQDGSAGFSGVAYYAWQTAGAAGAQSLGLSVPDSQRWVMAGVEVLAAGEVPGFAGWGVPL